MGFDTVICISVPNAFSRGNRTKVQEQIPVLLAPSGHSYLAVARNLRMGGRPGTYHGLQNSVVIPSPA